MTVIETQKPLLKQGAPDLIQRNETQKDTKETTLQLPTCEEVDTYFTAKQIPSSFRELTDVVQLEQDITAKQVELYFQEKISEISGLEQYLKQRSKDYYKDSHGAFHSGHLDRSPVPTELDAGYLADVGELRNHTGSEGLGGCSMDTEEIMAEFDAWEDFENPAPGIEGKDFLMCLETLEK